MPKSIIGAIVGVVLLLALLVSGPLAFVGPGERGVEVSTGRVTGKVYTEGWYFYNSILKDIVEYDTKSKVNTEEVAAASADLQDVIMSVALQYRLESESLPGILENIGKQKDVDEKLVDPALQETAKAVTAQFPVAEIIQKRAEVKSSIEKNLIERLEKYGVIVEEVSIKNIAFSPEFTQAIENKQVAQQQKEQTQFEADSAVIEAQGKATAQSLLRESLTPEVLERLRIEAWNGILPLYVGDANALVNLP